MMTIAIITIVTLSMTMIINRKMEIILITIMKMPIVKIKIQ